MPQNMTAKPYSFNKFSQNHRSQRHQCCLKMANNQHKRPESICRSCAELWMLVGCGVLHLIIVQNQALNGLPTPSSLRDLQYIIHTYVCHMSIHNLYIYIQIPRILTFQNYFLNYLASRYPGNTNQC